MAVGPVTLFHFSHERKIISLNRTSNIGKHTHRSRDYSRLPNSLLCLHVNQRAGLQSSRGTLTARSNIPSRQLAVSPGNIIELCSFAGGHVRLVLLKWCTSPFAPKSRCASSAEIHGNWLVYLHPTHA